MRKQPYLLNYMLFYKLVIYKHTNNILSNDIKNLFNLYIFICIITCLYIKKKGILENNKKFMQKE